MCVPSGSPLEPETRLAVAPRSVETIIERITALDELSRQIAQERASLVARLRIVEGVA